MTRKLVLVAGLTTLAIFSSGCEKLRARDHLNKGVQAFKGSKFPQAVEHFKEAVQLDPTFSTARLYLATAYMSQYIPGADSEENVKNAQAAEQEFLEVLKRDSSDKIAISSLASLHYNQAQGNQPMEQKVKKLDDAKKWYERLIEVDPQNKEAYYSLGVITWGKWYPALMGARAKLSMKPEDLGPIKDKKVKEELKAQWIPVVDDGLAKLNKALEIDPEYDDAMAYVNLLIRERADLADSPEEYKKGIDTADSWVEKALDTKKIKAERVTAKGAEKAE